MYRRISEDDPGSHTAVVKMSKRKGKKSALAKDSFDGKSKEQLKELARSALAKLAEKDEQLEEMRKQLARSDDIASDSEAAAYEKNLRADLERILEDHGEMRVGARISEMFGGGRLDVWKATTPRKLGSAKKVIVEFHRDHSLPGVPEIEED